MSNESRHQKSSENLTELHDLETRLNAARKKHQDPHDNAQDDGSLLGIAWRLSTELVVGICVGMGLGYGLDVLFGTKPWLLLVGLGFGFAAGIRNTIRASDQMEAANQMDPDKLQSTSNTDQDKN